MRKLMMVALLVLVGSVAGLFSARQAEATGCTTYCSAPDACGHFCCYKECCNGRCFILDCAPPPPCGGDN